jgi:hypothetical protein
MKKQSRGRPRLEAQEATVPVTVRLPTTQFDALCQRANQESKSLPAVIRDVLNKDSKKTAP